MTAPAFLFSLMNHTEIGKASLHDVVDILGQQLRSLGYIAEYQNHPEGHPWTLIRPEIGYNVMVEGFTPQVIEAIATAHAEGFRFICLATEEPTPLGFNYGKPREMRERQEMFPEAAKFFDAILHLVPGERVGHWYSQFAPTAYVELGYSEALIRPQYHIPTHDFVFFGSLSPRRRKLLQRLADFTVGQGAPRANVVRICMTFPSQGERDKILQEGKVVVQIRKDEELGLVSSSRCCTSLYNGRPVIAEPHDEDLSYPWNEIVRFTKSEHEFLLQAKLALSRWETLHQEQFARFKAKLTPTVCIGDALKRLGIDNGVRS